MNDVVFWVLIAAVAIPQVTMILVGIIGAILDVDPWEILGAIEDKIRGR